MIDLDRLRILHAVATSGSLSAAARALGSSQPAVSHHVRALEREVGTPLVARAGRGVRLTAAGEALAGHAAAILDRLAVAEEEVAALAGLRAGRVRVAAFPSAAAALVPPALAALAAAHPGLAVTLVEAESRPRPPPWSATARSTSRWASPTTTPATPASPPCPGPRRPRDRAAPATGWPAARPWTSPTWPRRPGSPAARAAATTCCASATPRASRRASPSRPTTTSPCRGSSPARAGRRPAPPPGAARPHVTRRGRPAGSSATPRGP